MTSHKPVQIAFGKALRKFRENAEISQEQLAAQARMNRTYVGDVERGERNVSIVNQYKLAMALNVKLSAIVTEMERQMARDTK